MQEHVAQINTYNGFISKKLPRQRMGNSSSFNNLQSHYVHRWELVLVFVIHKI
jgi:hypothetical protein